MLTASLQRIRTQVNWPNKATGGTKPVFELCYQTGLSCVAKQDLMWKPAGDPCVTPCYLNKAFLANDSAAAGVCP